MSTIDTSSIKASIDAAAGLYSRLVLLAGSNAEHRTAIVDQLAGVHGWPKVIIGLALSEGLLSLPSRQRPIELPHVASTIVDRAGSDVVLIDHIEILFVPELSQDPLKLLMGLSRNRTIVASWPGSFDGTYLVHAEPSHPEHVRQPAAGLLVVDVSQGMQSHTG